MASIFAEIVNPFLSYTLQRFGPEVSPANMSLGMKDTTKVAELTYTSTLTCYTLKKTKTKQ